MPRRHFAPTRRATSCDWTPRTSTSTGSGGSPGEGRAAIADGEPARGAELLRDALSLWRGRRSPTWSRAGIRWSELTAIEDERLSALEDRLDAELACGRHREITPELEVLTATEPLRERLCQQFMLALYRSGRQADALRVYRRTREALVDSLGLEPGRGLQELQQRILDHDAAIQARPPGADGRTSARTARRLPGGGRLRAP